MVRAGEQIELCIIHGSSWGVRITIKIPFSKIIYLLSIPFKQLTSCGILQNISIIISAAPFQTPFLTTHAKEMSLSLGQPTVTNSLGNFPFAQNTHSPEGARTRHRRPQCMYLLHRTYSVKRYITQDNESECRFRVILMLSVYRRSINWMDFFS